MTEKLDQLDKRFVVIDGRINLLQWMVGFNIAASVAIHFRLLTTS